MTEDFDRMKSQYDELRIADARRVLAPELTMLRDALKVADEAINPPDLGGLSLDVWNTRLKAATVTIRSALATHSAGDRGEPI